MRRQRSDKIVEKKKRKRVEKGKKALDTRLEI